MCVENVKRCLTELLRENITERLSVFDLDNLCGNHGSRVIVAFPYNVIFCVNMVNIVINAYIIVTVVHHYINFVRFIIINSGTLTGINVIIIDNSNIICACCIGFTRTDLNARRALGHGRV